MMIRSLFVISASGLVLSMVCFGGVMALGGRDLMRDGWRLALDEDTGIVISEAAAPADLGPETRRELAWDGAAALTLDVPGDVVFVQGDPAGVTVRGPQAVIRRVALEDGRLFLADPEDGRRWRPRQGLEV